MPLICENCRQPTRAVFQQDDGRLFCRPCHSTVKYSRPTTAVFRDDIPGGLTVENYGPKPITFYSHTERRAYMARQGLYERETFAPMPGTDKDPQGIPNPKGYMDPQTLENARILVSRGSRAEVEPDVPIHLTSGTLTNRDAQAIHDGDARRLSRLHRRTDGHH